MYALFCSYTPFFLEKKKPESSFQAVLPVWTSQSLTVSSNEPLTTIEFCGLKLQQKTKLEWPTVESPSACEGLCSVILHVAVDTSQIFRVLSSDAEQTNL